MKYRKRPIVVEAFQYGYDVPQWAVESLYSGILTYGQDNGDEPENLYINTLEGKRLVSLGDYIIKGIQGELYPCKPDIFNLTYEIVDLGGEWEVTNDSMISSSTQEYRKRNNGGRRRRRIWNTYMLTMMRKH